MCSVVSFLSLGNIDFGVLLFKMLNLIIHLANAYLLYKISNKKIFPLMYGLNPFILIEGISNVHNDLYMVFFVLLAIYELLKKKNILTSIVFLALATDIKYFSILLLPLFIIYHFRDKTIKVRFIKCIQYGILFLIIVLIPYLVYIRDISVFSGILTQNSKLSKGFFLFIYLLFDRNIDIFINMKIIAFCTLFFTYLFKNIKLLTKGEISFINEMQEQFWFIMFFLFFFITNFQPWYFIWLSIFIVWQKPQNIRLILQVQLLTMIANTVFILFTENYKFDIFFFSTFMIGVAICLINNQKYRVRQLKKRNKKIAIKQNNSI